MISIPVINLNSHRALAMLRFLHDKGEVTQMKEMVEKLNMDESSLYEVAQKLAGKVIVSFKGRQGGYALINPEISVGEVCLLVGAVMRVDESPVGGLIHTGLMRLMRTRISDLGEK